MNYTRWSAKPVPDVYTGSGQNFEDAFTYLKNWIEVRTDALLEGWVPGQNKRK